MCGIVGYVGPDQALPIVIAGLRRLEYRGYDSAGVALVGEATEIRKRAGRLAVLEAPTYGPGWLPSDQAASALAASRSTSPPMRTR
jgi:glucosamine 6-phosphate synthetase-like amidotransferase/phosphosugar isomerase protein